MIFLTKANEDKDRELINYKLIESIATTINKTSNLFMTTGKVYTVIETEEEIVQKIIDFEAGIIRKALVKAKEVV